MPRDLVEVLCHRAEVFLHRFGCETLLAAELTGKLGNPFLDDLPGITGIGFVGKALVLEQHQHVAVN